MRARHGIALGLLTGMLAVAVALALSMGAVSVPVVEVVRALTGGTVTPQIHEIVRELRLPRVVAAVVVGAALAISGTLLQRALANPLASPDVIGVTGGAGFGATLILLAFPDQQPLVPLGALLCGLLAASMVLLLGGSGARGGSIERVVLAGIAIAALFGAATTALMVAFPERVPAAIGFLAGGLLSDGWGSTAAAAPYLAAGVALSFSVSRSLDRLALGDDVANSLGTSPRRTRLLAAGAASVLAAAAASIAGLLGFLGLIVPHLIRLAAPASTARWSIVLGALAGAIILVLGDALARTALAPIELPVGPLMVLLGVPWFLHLLRRLP